MPRESVRRIAQVPHDQVLRTGTGLNESWSRIWFNCVSKRLQLLLSAHVYSVENMRTPGFSPRLLLEIAFTAHESEAYRKALQAIGSGAERDFRIVEGA
jgi:hypothetical protein